jgi:hypothetical protein
LTYYLPLIHWAFEYPLQLYAIQFSKNNSH